MSWIPSTSAGISSGSFPSSSWVFDSDFFLGFLFWFYLWAFWFLFLMGLFLACLLFTCFTLLLFFDVGCFFAGVFFYCSFFFLFFFSTDVLGETFWVSPRIMLEGGLSYFYFGKIIFFLKSSSSSSWNVPGLVESRNIAYSMQEYVLACMTLMSVLGVLSVGSVCVCLVIDE